MRSPITRAETREVASKPGSIDHLCRPIVILDKAELPDRGLGKLRTAITDCNMRQVLASLLCLMQHVLE